MAADSAPFRETDELITKLIDPAISVTAATHLGDELSCPVLDELYPNLDFVARKSSLHIDPIHKHLQKCRKIIIIEDPKLHLIWNYGIVYLKPLPHYLLSYSFWNEHLGLGSVHRGEALGFVRSYARLIRHRSDFALALEAGLIPSSAPPASYSSSPSQPPGPTGELTYAALSTFLRHFSEIPDADVSPRWRFGQLRLSRLNWAQYWQTGQFLNEFAAPFIFLFATLSLILSGMQVVLAAEVNERGKSWHVFAEVSAWFSVAVIIIITVLFVSLGAVAVAVWAWQFQFSYRSWKKSRAEIKAINVEAGREEQNLMLAPGAFREQTLKPKCHDLTLG
ncbi:hypothetical protein B0T25DRAFT_630759 [Lasiosphaeria hispida]|uniref:Uncharacterized protein n=1 Tax=Lasiosphaeria hispida TaxID=260671 RepID=A0AAJ0MGH5_9PEZI|nr:hypothetical protein B0T25DRAFT_630759 [Lasiosphaeria hispida]